MWLWDVVLNRKQQNAAEPSKAGVTWSWHSVGLLSAPAQQSDQRCQCQDEPNGSPAEPKERMAEQCKKWKQPVGANVQHGRAGVAMT